MIRRKHVAGEFFSEAETMREAIDSRFKDAYSQAVKWNYFSVPRLYTYLRVSPQEIIPEDLYRRFMSRFKEWCTENLGLAPIGDPALHLMVNGCKLELHSDFHNGTWGYVYSLTRWQNRHFSGGETLLMRDGVPSFKKHHAHGEELYELVPAHFNQLLVFDDRIAHATPVIEGTMDPMEGRIALVGHIRATSPTVTGHLVSAEVESILLEAYVQLQNRLKPYKDVHGTITYRLSIGTTGRVESITTLTDNLITSLTGYEHSDAVAAVRSVNHHILAKLKFSEAAGSSVILIPIIVPLPDLRPIEIAFDHELTREAVCKRVATLLLGKNDWGIKGVWDADMFVVHEPLAGYIKIDSHQVSVRFQSPMWVPSQREEFQLMLSEHLRKLLTNAPIESAPN